MTRGRTPELEMQEMFDKMLTFFVKPSPEELRKGKSIVTRDQFENLSDDFVRQFGAKKLSTMTDKNGMTILGHIADKMREKEDELLIYNFLALRDTRFKRDDKAAVIDPFLKNNSESKSAYDIARQNNNYVFLDTVKSVLEKNKNHIDYPAYAPVYEKLNSEQPIVRPSVVSPVPVDTDDEPIISEAAKRIMEQERPLQYYEDQYKVQYEKDKAQFEKSQAANIVQSAVVINGKTERQLNLDDIRMLISRGEIKKGKRSDADIIESYFDFNPEKLREKDNQNNTILHLLAQKVSEATNKPDDQHPYAVTIHNLIGNYGANLVDSFFAVNNKGETFLQIAMKNKDVLTNIDRGLTFYQSSIDARTSRVELDKVLRFREALGAVLQDQKIEDKEPEKSQILVIKKKAAGGNPNAFNKAMTDVKKHMEADNVNEAYVYFKSKKSLNKKTESAVWCIQKEGDQFKEFKLDINPKTIKNKLESKNEKLLDRSSFDEKIFNAVSKSRLSFDVRSERTQFRRSMEAQNPQTYIPEAKASAVKVESPEEKAARRAKILEQQKIDAEIARKQLGEYAAAEAQKKAENVQATAADTKPRVDLKKMVDGLVQSRETFEKRNLIDAQQSKSIKDDLDKLEIEIAKDPSKYEDYLKKGKEIASALKTIGENAQANRAKAQQEAQAKEAARAKALQEAQEMKKVHNAQATKEAARAKALQEAQEMKKTHNAQEQAKQKMATEPVSQTPPAPLNQNVNSDLQKNLTEKDHAKSRMYYALTNAENMVSQADGNLSNARRNLKEARDMQLIYKNRLDSNPTQKSFIDDVDKQKEEINLKRDKLIDATKALKAANDALDQARIAYKNSVSEFEQAQIALHVTTAPSRPKQPMPAEMKNEVEMNAATIKRLVGEKGNLNDAIQKQLKIILGKDTDMSYGSLTSTQVITNTARANPIVFRTNISTDGADKHVASVLERGENPRLRIYYDKNKAYSPEECARWAKAEMDKFRDNIGGSSITIVGDVPKNFPNEFIKAVIDHCAKNGMSCDTTKVNGYQAATPAQTVIPPTPPIKPNVTQANLAKPRIPTPITPNSVTGQAGDDIFKMFETDSEQKIAATNLKEPKSSPKPLPPTPQKEPLKKLSPSELDEMFNNLLREVDQLDAQINAKAPKANDKVSLHNMAHATFVPDRHDPIQLISKKTLELEGKIKELKNIDPVRQRELEILHPISKLEETIVSIKSNMNRVTNLDQKADSKEIKVINATIDRNIKTANEELEVILKKINTNPKEQRNDVPKLK